MEKNHARSNAFEDGCFLREPGQDKAAGGLGGREGDVNKDTAFLASLVESEILRDSELEVLGDSALLEACFRVAAYAVPLPADTDRPGPPSDFLALTVQVAREAFDKIVAKREVQTLEPGIDEELVKSVRLRNLYKDHPRTIAADLGLLPTRLPRTAQAFGEAEWTWSPWHERWDRWYLSKDSTRRAWVLWVVTPNWRDCGLDRRDYAMAMVASKKVDRRTAAMHTLVAALRRDARDSDIEPFHSATAYGVLSMDDLEIVAEAVWERDAETVAEPLIDKNQMNDTIIRAWRSRVASLGRT